MDWQHENGQLLYQNDILLVKLKGDIKHDKEIAAAYFLNPHFLCEWKEYRVMVENKESSQRYGENEITVFFGGRKATYDNDGELWSFTFKNYIGKSEIRIFIKDRSLPTLPVEVTSQKLSLDKEDELFYPIFFRALADDLRNYQLTLPFEISSPTFMPVEDVPIPPNLLILFIQIMANSERIVQGIQAILMDPHRDLTTEEAFVDLHEVENVTPDVCISVFHHPDKLKRLESTKCALGFKLKGFIPQEMLQFRNIETFDTPENRFVKRFIKELLNSMKQIEELGVLRGKSNNGLEDRQNRWLQTKGSLETALSSQCLQEVNDTNLPFASASQVLLKRDGYREILQAYNELLLSKSPVFTYLREKTNERNVAEMYEFWCFFELTKELANFLNVETARLKVVVETTLTGGLTQSRTRSIIGDYELVYNKRFGRGKGSYSVPLKPDFSLLKGDKALVAFDAKFRFDEVSDEYLEKASQEDYPEEATVQRIADISDIYKMHAYRDALGARSAVILYPGNKNMFFSKNMNEKTTGDHAQILQKICSMEEGVAYLALVPGARYKKLANPVV